MRRRIFKSIRGSLYTKFSPFLHRSVAALFRSSTFLFRKSGLLHKPDTEGTQASFLIIDLTPHLGDTIMRMPMIEALRHAHPQAKIECAVETAAAPLLRAMPAVDHVYALKLGHIPPIARWRAIRRTFLVIYRSLQVLHQSSPTVCIMPRWGDDLFQSCVAGYLTGAPRRVGFALANKGEGRRSFHYRDTLLTEQVEGGSGLHEPERFCLLLKEAGLIPPSGAAEAGTRTIASLKYIAAKTDWQALATQVKIDTTTPFAVIAPGASMPRRIWPLNFWAEVMKELRAKGMQIVLLSGEQDAAIAIELHRLTGGCATLVAGQTNLLQSVALISYASLFLGNDSGAGHVAGALGIPSVILFIAETGCDTNAPSAPERIHPVGPRVAFCRPSECLPPCVKCCEASEAHCIRTILPSEVIATAERILQQREAGEGVPVSSEAND